MDAYGLAAMLLMFIFLVVIVPYLCWLDREDWNGRRRNFLTGKIVEDRKRRP